MEKQTQQNTSLIITKENSGLVEDLIYFKKKDYTIIPTNADFMQFHYLIKNGFEYPNVQEIFDRTFADNDEYGNYNDRKTCDLTNYENLLLIELIKKLNLENFCIYHHSKVGRKEYRYWSVFENSILEYYDFESYIDIFELDFKPETYFNFETSKEMFFNQIGNR